MCPSSAQLWPPFIWLLKPPELTMLNSPDAALRLCVGRRAKTSSSEDCPGVSLTSCRALDLGVSLVCKLGWASAATKRASPSMLVTTLAGGRVRKPRPEILREEGLTLQRGACLWGPSPGCCLIHLSLCVLILKWSGSTSLSELCVDFSHFAS